MSLSSYWRWYLLVLLLMDFSHFEASLTEKKADWKISSWKFLLQFQGRVESKRTAGRERGMFLQWKMGCSHTQLGHLIIKNERTMTHTGKRPWLVWIIFKANTLSSNWMRSCKRKNAGISPTPHQRALKLSSWVILSSFILK